MERRSRRRDSPHSQLEVRIDLDRARFWAGSVLISVLALCVDFVLCVFPVSGSEEDRKWFMEAMQAQTVDVIKRMKEITMVMQTPEQVLESQGVTAGDIEGNVAELCDLCCS